MDVLSPELWRAVLGTVLSAAILTGLRFMTPRARHGRLKERLSRLEESTDLAAAEVSEVDRLLDAHPRHRLGPVTMDRLERVRRLDVRRPPSPAVIHQERRAALRSFRAEARRRPGGPVSFTELQTLQSLAIRRCAAIESAAEITETMALARQRYLMQVGTSNTSRWGQGLLTVALVVPIIAFGALMAAQVLFTAEGSDPEKLTEGVVAWSTSVSLVCATSGGWCAGYVRSRLLPPDRSHRLLISIVRVVVGTVLGVVVGLLYTGLWLMITLREMPT